MSTLAASTTSHPSSRARGSVAVPKKTLPSRSPKETKPRSDSRLEARIPTNVLARVKRAAALEQRTLTDFVVTHLNEAAQQALLDQTFFSVNEADFKAFEAMMAAPMSENIAVQELLSSRSPWDK